ncbi:MAG: hypothetical protein IPQ08_10630 [Chitinophagaceae bacterium]|nr:hypothetical protein [Chitinophagaceae bacterium]
MKSRIVFTLGITIFLFSIGMIIKTNNPLEEGFYTGLSILSIVLIFRSIANKLEG